MPHSPTEKSEAIRVVPYRADIEELTAILHRLLEILEQEEQP